MPDQMFELDRASREQREETFLAPAATRSAESRGRAEPEEDDPYRTCFDNIFLAVPAPVARPGRGSS